MTITSADEDAFIFNNVPQGNIWFTLTDELVEGQWRIDAGPEAGTLIKTSNGQFAGNIVGQYNNWAGGEPNNSGNEDYAVTKWNGSQWNDLPNGFWNPYVIEYGTWTNPDDATFTEFYTNSVTHTNGDVLTARFNFDFGGNVDETKFTAKANTFVNNVWGVTTNTSRALSGLGKTDITNDLDTIKVNGNGVRATTTGGEAEWCVVYDYEPQNQRYQILIDKREFPQGISASSVTSLQLFDLWNGAVTYQWDDGTWAAYWIYTPTELNFAGSSFTSRIRRAGFFWGLRAEFTFTPNTIFKQHGIDLSYTNQTELNTLYNSIISVSDVFLAFKELSNGGIFGNQSGLEFTSGIQFMNADVDGNGVFNESDTYKLLQHLIGAEPLTQFSTLTYLMKLYSKSEYDAITKSNWNTQFNSTRSLFPFSLNTGTLNNTYNVEVTWVGDVNLSHSAQQTQSSVASMSVRTMSLPISNEINASIITELVGDSVNVYVTIDPLQQQLVGTQFQLNYDNSLLKFSSVSYKTKGSPTNYGTDKGDYVNFGSLITGEGVLDNTTEYKISFKPQTKLDNILGLVSVKFMDAVNKSGRTLKVTMK